MGGVAEAPHVDVREAKEAFEIVQARGEMLKRDVGMNPWGLARIVLRAEMRVDVAAQALLIRQELEELAEASAPAVDRGRSPASSGSPQHRPAKFDGAHSATGAGSR